MIEKNFDQILTQDSLLNVSITHSILALVPKMHAEYFKLVVEKIDGIFDTFNDYMKKRALKHIFKSYPQYKPILKKSLTEIKTWHKEASRYEIKKNMLLWLQMERNFQTSNSSLSVYIPTTILWKIMFMTANKLYLNEENVRDIMQEEINENKELISQRELLTS